VKEKEEKIKENARKCINIEAALRACEE